MNISFYFVICCKVGRYSSDSIDSLRAGRSEDRIPEEARYFSPVQNRPGAHWPSYTMRTGSFPGDKAAGVGVGHHSLSNSEVKEKVELCIFSLFGASWLVLGRNFAYLRVTQYSARLIKICIERNVGTWFIQNQRTRFFCFATLTPTMPMDSNCKAC